MKFKIIQKSRVIVQTIEFVFEHEGVNYVGRIEDNGEGNTKWLLDEDENEIKEESFDFLFDMQCFHVLRDINTNLFCEIVYKLLKKGGKLMVVVGANIDTYAKDKLMEKSENAKGPCKLYVDVS